MRSDLGAAQGPDDDEPIYNEIPQELAGDLELQGDLRPLGASFDEDGDLLAFGGGNVLDPEEASLRTPNDLIFGPQSKTLASSLVIGIVLNLFHVRDRQGEGEPPSIRALERIDDLHEEGSTTHIPFADICTQVCDEITERQYGQYLYVPEVLRSIAGMEEQIIEALRPMVFSVLNNNYGYENLIGDLFAPIFKEILSRHGLEHYPGIELDPDEDAGESYNMHTASIAIPFNLPFGNDIRFQRQGEGEDDIAFKQND